MNIIILEDHPVLRDALLNYLTTKYEPENIEAFCTPKNATDYIRKNRIDLIIVDLEYKDDSCGLKFVKNFRKSNKETKLIAYTSHKVFSIISELKSCGFNSYICKEESFDQLTLTIDRVMKKSSNSFFESPSYVQFMNERNTVTDKFFNTTYEQDHSLTPTERRVSNYVKQDPKLSNTELSKKLDIKLNTLKKHITSIYKKLNVSSKEGIALFLQNMEY